MLCRSGPATKQPPSFEPSVLVGEHSLGAAVKALAAVPIPASRPGMSFRMSMGPCKLPEAQQDHKSYLYYSISSIHVPVYVLQVLAGL